MGGRKPRVEENEIRAAMAACKSPKDVGDKLSLAIDAGEPWAITLWYAYYYGKPRERVEISGADGEPLFDYAKAVQALTGNAPGSTDGGEQPGADYHDGDGEALG